MHGCRQILLQGRDQVEGGGARNIKREGDIGMLQDFITDPEFKVRVEMINILIHFQTIYHFSLVLLW